MKCAAAADVESLPTASQPSVRYLTLYAIEPAKRRQAFQTVGYVLNSIAQTRAISQPVLVSPTLVRFSIGQYAPRADEFAAWFVPWEKLAEADPYFHLRTEVVIKGEGGRRNCERLLLPPSAFRIPP